MRRSLRIYAFLAIAAVALLSVVSAGLIARFEASSAFDAYVQTLPSNMGRGMGAGRQLMMGASEQTFLGSLDKGILIGAIIAVVLALAAALAAAYYLTRPLKRLTEAAKDLAEGDLSRRVGTEGPAEVAHLGQAFNDMASSLAEAEVLRRRLVADVAHELRNPIASLRAQAEGIAEGVLQPDPARLASLSEDAVHLSRLVDDLQELSAADAGQLSYRMERTDLRVLVGSEIARARARAGERVTVASDCSGAEAIADEGRIAQVLRNLLDNALRHTDAGTVAVSCSVGRDQITVEVSDTGEGIPAADLPYVFERFYRADAARARDTGGSGIGLAVSRRIVEDHGGTVFARNREDGGAVVGFTLPVPPEPGA